MLACGALMVGAGTAGAAGNPAAGTEQKYTALEDGIPHATVGCDGARVLTPRPGTQFADPVGAMPESAISFYAKAASLDVTWASTLHCNHTGLVHWPMGDTDERSASAIESARSGAVIDTIQDSTAWSGYQINNLAHYVQSGWTIPTVVNPPIGHHYSTTGYASSIWDGMGGGSHDYITDLPLIQAGSTQTLSSTGVASYYFWYEIVGGSAPTSGEMQIAQSALHAHPGDDVGAMVLWLDDTQTTEFGLCDFSDSSPPGGCIQIEWNCPDDGHCSEEPGAATTEWIVEAPFNGLQNRPLADFGLVNFYNGCWSADSDLDPCYAISEPGVTVTTPYWLYLNVFGTKQYLAKPGQITSGSSFTDTYYLPQNPNQ
jgi:hypothetical protein